MLNIHIGGTFMKKTNEQFLKDLSEKNPDVIPLEEYNGAMQKIKCKCKKCGHEWQATPNNLLHPYGCPKCSKNACRKDVSKRLIHCLIHMKQRCYNPNDTRYNCYGGKGIKICDEWLNDSWAFYNWALSNGYKEGLTIERKDVNKDYCPENCCWITKDKQQSNTSRNHFLTYNGRTETIAEWGRIMGLSKGVILNRLSLGWSVEDAITTKVNGTRPLNKVKLLRELMDYKEKMNKIKEILSEKNGVADSQEFGLSYGQAIDYLERIAETIQND